MARRSMIKEENGVLLAHGDRASANKLAELPFVKTVKHTSKLNIIEFTVEDDIRLKEVQPNMIVFEQHISEFEVMGIKL